MWWMALASGIAHAEDCWDLENPGRVDETAPVALVVTTPGVAVSAYGRWVEALEGVGFDARTLVFRPGGLDDMLAGIQEVTTGFEGRSYVIAAHGYGGVLTLLSQVSPSRMALVAVPLGAQLTSVRWPEPVSASGLPWPETWVGSLPGDTLAPELAKAYRNWAEDFPSYTAPSMPTWLAASGIDPIAPPEVVRLPSQAWPDRTWKRVGPLSLDFRELTHAEMLTESALAQKMASFLAEGP